MCTVAFNLLVGGDGAEDDFGKLSAVEGTVCDSSAVCLASLQYEGSLYGWCTQQLPEAS